MSRASLIEAYISGLQSQVSVVGAGRQCRIHAGDPEPGETIAHRYFFKPSHAELLLATIGKDGLSGKPAAMLAGAIERAAAMLGAPIRTLPELRKAAAQAVDEITVRVKLASQDGGLKHWNTRYRQYRLAQVAKAEQAISYQAFIERFVTTPTVRNIAATGG